MKSIIQKRIIPAITQSQDEKFSNQSTMWSTKVSSGHNICCLCSFLVELSSCRVTYENCYKSSGFSNLVRGEWMDLRNSNGFELRKFYFQPYRSFSQKFSSEVEKCIIWSSVQVLPNQVSKKIVLYVWRYWLTRVPCKVTKKNRVKLWEQIEFKG